MEKLRILVSAYAFSPNAKTPTDFDPGVLAWNLIDRLRRFYDIWVITHNENTDCVMDALSAGELSKVNIHFVNLPKCRRFTNKTVIGRWFCYYLWQRNAWKYARDLHSQVKFDAFHHLTLEYDWVPSFIGAYLPIPFIWGPLGGGEKASRGFGIRSTVSERWKNLWNVIAQRLGRRHHARKEDEARARAILICNHETRHRFLKTDVRKFRYFPLTGVFSDTIRSNPKKRASDKRTFRIISSGILEKKSGFDLAIEAFSLFSKSFPESDFVIFGEGPEKNQLEREIKKHGIESRVRIHPWIGNDALHERMRDSDVFLSTGIEDTSGFFVVRALSAGLPVVCLDSGGPGMIVQEKWGVLIKPEDPEQCVRDLAEALKDICTDSARHRKMSLAALKNAKEHYTWEGLAKRLKRIYGEILLQEENIRFSRRGEERFFY